MTKLSLSDVARLLNEAESPEEIMQQDGIMEYLSDCDVMATNILREVSDENIEVSIALVQALVASMQLEKGMGLTEFMFIQSDVFRLACSIAFKMGVGIAAMEELR